MSAAQDLILETRENSQGGVLVVVPFGHGLPEISRQTQTRSAFFSDKSADRGPTLSALIDWFHLWGMPLASVRGSESAFERSFAVTVWPSVPIEGHGPQMIKGMTQSLPELARTVAQRRPRLMLILSCYLWQAMNTLEGHTLLEPVLGTALDDGRRISNERLTAFTQCWQNCRMVALPLPSKNTTERFVTSLAGEMQSIIKSTLGVTPSALTDPLLTRACDWLVLDTAASVRAIRSHLFVDEQRAQKLLDTLTGTALIQETKTGVLRINPKGLFKLTAGASALPIKKKPSKAS